MSTKMKVKRSYNKNSLKRKLYTITTDMKHLQKNFDKLQADIGALRETARKKKS